MQLNVRTDHQIIPFDNDRMALFDNNSGSAIVTATREDGTWTISGAGAEDRTADNRADAIQALIDHALESQPDSGYSTLVPHGLADLP